jgi:GNAT superfamily N-acetyltransferase
VTAVEDNLVAQFRLIAASGVVTPLPDEDVVAYASEVPFALFNGIAGARFAPGTEAARTRELISGFIARGRPFLWWGTPSTMTPEIEAMLRSLGIEPESEPGMHRLLHAPVDPCAPAGVEVEAVSVTDELVRVMVDGFGFPDFVVDPLTRGLASAAPETAFHVIARLHGVPVSAGSVFATGTTAGIYNIATVRSARRRGIGHAVTAELMNLALARGCTEAVLMASDMGRPTYERLGFVEVCQTAQYVWLPAA